VDWFARVDWPALAGPGCVIFGVAYCAYHWRTSDPPQTFTSPHVRGKFLEGAAMFPMILMVFTPVSDSLVKFLISGDKVVLAGSAFVAILALLDKGRAKNGTNGPTGG
jgi:hypothetical protein